MSDNPYDNIHVNLPWSEKLKGINFTNGERAKAKITAERLTSGWAFLGIAKEDHDRDVQEIVEYLQTKGK
jgi:hypothetical protein